MPPAQNANLKAPVLPPSLVTAVRYTRDKRTELERLNGSASDLTRGHIGGITTALAYILEGLADNAGTTTRARVVIPAATVAAIARIRAQRTELEKKDGTEEDQGVIVGLTEVLALILEAAVDEADNPMSPL